MPSAVAEEAKDTDLPVKAEDPLPEPDTDPEQELARIREKRKREEEEEEEEDAFSRKKGGFKLTSAEASKKPGAAGSTAGKLKLLFGKKSQ